MQFTIRPFAEHDLTNHLEEASDHWHWNQELSTLHITVEHVFRHLKGPALQALPGTNLKSMWETVEVLLIIHNILTELGDNPYEIQGFNGEEDLDPIPDEAAEDILVSDATGHTCMTEDGLYCSGLLQRKHLLNNNDTRFFIH